MYHRVAAPASDPWQLSVSPAHFEEHLQVLKRRGLLLPIREVANALTRRKAPRRFFAVTFDDGYVDNLKNAKPLLERHGVPATIFVTSGWLGRARPFWWDELEQLLLFSDSLPERVRIDTPEGPWEHPLQEAENVRDLPLDWRAASGAKTKRQAAYLAVHALLSSYGPSECERGMAQLREQIAPSRAGRSNGDAPRPLSPEEVPELARGGLVEIGAHGLTHARLARLPAEDQRREIAESRRQLEEISGGRVSTFAYPFGGKSDFTERTASIVREEGFSAACAATPGAVREASDPWRLPRFHVTDSDGDLLARRISRWLAA